MLSRSASFAVAAIAGTAALTAASAPSPLYPVYQQLWDFSAFTLTAVFAVYVFALLVALLTVGSLSDHVGRRPVVSAALVLLTVGMLLFVRADSAADLMVARVVQGLAVGAAASTTTAMIMDHAPTARRGSTMSGVVPTLGLSIGLVGSGALVEFAPHPRQLVFWLFAAGYLVIAALVWLTPGRPDDRATPDISVWQSLKPSAAVPSEVRHVIVALVPAMVATWALGGLYLSLGSSVLGAVLGVRSHFVVGVALAAFFLAGVTGTVAASSLPARRRDLVAYGSLVVGVSVTVVATLMSSLAPYVAGSVVAGFGFGAAFSFVVAGLGQAAPSDRRGEVFATMYIVSYLAFSLPALAAGLADEAFGLRPTVVAYGGVVVALAVLALVTQTVRSRPRDDRQRRSPAPTIGS